MEYKESKYNCILEKEGQTLIYNSLTNQFFCANCSYQDISTEVRIQNRLLISKELDEEKLALAKFIRLQEDNSRLQLVILPTMDCNFACTYCYEEKRQEYMSEDVQNAILRYVKKNIQGKSEIAISWFGGEPLLCKDVVTNICTEVKKMANYYHTQFISGMTTNGYLLDCETFRELLKLNVRTYQITIDGNEVSHNETRPLRDGRGSYQTIMKNLKNIRDTVKTRNFTIVIRLNMTTEFLPMFEEITKELTDEFGDDRRFQFYFKEVGNYGGDSVKEMQEELIQDASCIEKCLLNCKDTFSIENQYHMFSKNPLCYAACHYNHVIKPDGTIAKCTVYFSSEKNKIGTLTKEGNMIYNEFMHEWEFVALDAYKSEKCGTCSFYANCFYSGCPSQKVVKGEYLIDKTTCNLRDRAWKAIEVMYRHHPERFITLK